MKKNKTINPTGLKGNDVTDRMRSLMNLTPIKESVDRSVIELTKKGPDGKIYAIVRENHNFFIKTSIDKENLIKEDFAYMGGLKNKMNESYPTYAKAIKRLSLKFISLNEAYDITGDAVDTFKSENLIAESQKGYGGSFGFVQEDEIDEVEMDVVTEEDIEMSENEEAIDEMIDPNGMKSKEDKENSGDNLEGDYKDKPKGSSTNTGKIKEGKKKFSILEGINKMDSIIDEISGVDTKLDAVLEGLNDADKAIVMEALKKKS
jgi:hypothetical protein